jgi:hypothetical protein
MAPDGLRVVSEGSSIEPWERTAERPGPDKDKAVGSQWTRPPAISG